MSEKMTTVEIPTELYDQLVALATEMTTQDNRITAMPHLFQIREEEKVYDWGLNGDNYCLIYNGEGEHEYESEEDLKIIITEFCEGRDFDYPDMDEMDMDEMIEWLEKQGYERCTWSTRFLYENAFFTAKGCQEHIRKNMHHYNKPVDYLNHAFRNPEMELISTFLCGLVGKPLMK